MQGKASRSDRKSKTGFQHPLLHVNDSFALGY